MGLRPLLFKACILFTSPLHALIYEMKSQHYSTFNQISNLGLPVTVPSLPPTHSCASKPL